MGLGCEKLIKVTSTLDRGPRVLTLLNRKSVQDTTGKERARKGMLGRGGAWQGERTKDTRWRARESWTSC